MSVSGDDSDATVLADDGVDKSVGEESQCVDRVCESPEATVSSSPSPSILHTTLKSLIHQRSSSRKESGPTHEDTQLSQCCSEDAMSQEFPPLTTLVTVSSDGVGTNQQVHSSSEGTNVTTPPQSSTEPTLHDVAKQQINLLQEIQRLKLTSQLSSQALGGVRGKAADIEGRLKNISTANQAERKRLAEAHASLSQQVNSQQEFVSVSQALKQQLVGLANKQKLLLECFSRQKEIGTLLSQQTLPPKVPPEPSGVSEALTSSSKILSERVLSSLSSLQLSAPPTGGTSSAPPTGEPTRPPLATAQSLTQSTTAQTSIVCQTVSSLTVPQSKHSQQTIVSSSGTAPVMVGLPINSLAHTLSQANRAPSTHPHPHHPPTHKSHPLPNKAPASAGLSEPVPLDALIKHGFLEPAQNCLSCCILGCQFLGSLLRDGSIQESGGTPQGTRYQLPRLWVKACWAQLGHHQKKISKKVAYTCVLYRDKPLISYCERYSLKQVSSYLSQQSCGESVRAATLTRASTDGGTSDVTVTPDTGSVVGSASQMRTVKAPTPILNNQFNLPQLLREGSVFLLPHHCTTQLDLPPGFWDNRGVPLTPQLVQQIQSDLDW